MELRSGEAFPDGQPAAEGEAREPTSNDTAVGKGSAVGRPAFTPAEREADDDAEPGDMQAPRPTVFEPAGYTRVADAREPAGTPLATEDDYPAGNLADAGSDEGASAYETPEAHETPAAHEMPAAHETWPTAAAGSMTAAPATSSETQAPVAPAGTDQLAGMDQPLLSGDTEMLARWQLVQVGFIDDPQAAVAGAAELVEQAGQALVEALRERQQQTRAIWDHGPAAHGDLKPDTEQLRQVMQRYHALFKQLNPS